MHHIIWFHIFLNRRPKQGHHLNGDRAAWRPHIIVLDLPSLICGFDESCTIVHCITLQPANVS